LTVSVPVNPLLDPPRVQVPAPALVMLPAPERAPLYVGLSERLTASVPAGDGDRAGDGSGRAPVAELEGAGADGGSAGV